MTRTQLTPGRLAEQTLAVGALALVALFTYGLFFRIPYTGFTLANDRVQRVFVPSTLRPGDQVLRIGPVDMAAYLADLHMTLMDGVRPGQVIPVLVQRDGQATPVAYVFPGFTTNELWDRLASQWLLALVFWLFGELALLLIRPRNAVSRLLTAFSFVTAIWLAASGVSRWHVLHSALVLRATLWLAVPVYWHFHWIFPKPLGRLPRLAWPLAYLVGIGLAGAEWMRLLPAQAYVGAFLLALGGSLFLLAAHLVRQPAQRRDVGLIGVAGAVAFGLPITLGAFQALDVYPYLALGGLLALPLLPGAYFYAAFRRQLGGLEIRRNRLLALYLFVLVLGTALILLHALLGAWWDVSGEVLLAGVVASGLAALVALVAYGPFQRLVERRLLGVPPAPTHLLETYPARIATRLDVPGLVRLLADEVLPSLLVRQSALLRVDDGGLLRAVYMREVEDGDLPADRDLPELLAGAGQFRPVHSGDAGTPPSTCAWVRLALPLRLGDRLTGLWLLGRRDPDDEYAQPEIAVLQALADQTAIALAHVDQSDLLRAAYRADIDRMETERASLARELHDHILGELAALKGTVEAQALPPGFLDSYGRVASGLRQTITGLRPAMLTYGLRAALNSLVDALADRAPGNPAVELDVPESGARHDAGLEQHLYRIVQQACENALRHARARRLRIHGRLEQEAIDLVVEDDGVGFEAGERLDLAGLIAHKHFGLAGMYERATLIDARLRVDSTPGRGTRVRITWAAPDRE